MLLEGGADGGPQARPIVPRDDIRGAGREPGGARALVGHAGEHDHRRRRLQVPAGLDGGERVEPRWPMVGQNQVWRDVAERGDERVVRVDVVDEGLDGGTPQLPLDDVGTCGVVPEQQNPEGLGHTCNRPYCNVRAVTEKSRAPRCTDTPATVWPSRLTWSRSSCRAPRAPPQGVVLDSRGQFTPD